MRSDRAVDLRYCFVNQVTGAAARLDKFDFTFYDFDDGAPMQKRNAEDVPGYHEQLVIGLYERYRLSTQVASEIAVGVAACWKCPSWRRHSSPARPPRRGPASRLLSTPRRSHTQPRSTH